MPQKAGQFDHGLTVATLIAREVVVPSGQPDTYGELVQFGRVRPWL